MESGHPYVVTLSPELTASIGGLPLVVDGKVVGGIGVSGRQLGAPISRRHKPAPMP